MSSLTEEIIAILRRNGRISYSEIARELNTSRDHVASQINPLLESGDLRIVAGVHPSVLGLNVCAHLSIRVSGEVSGVVEALERLAAPVLISVVSGSFQVVVELRLPSIPELQGQVALIREIEGVAEVSVLLYERVLNSFFLREELDSSSFDFDATDLRIISILQQDGRANFAAVAEQVGMSLSGCRTRVQHLLDSGVLQIGAIKKRSDTTDDLLVGIGVNATEGLHEITELLCTNTGLEFIARTVGRFDLIATVGFASLRDFKRFLSRLRCLVGLTSSEQWLHVSIVREAPWGRRL
jgi:DNA-binding Lrp family transcriptional regulator